MQMTILLMEKYEDTHRLLVLDTLQLEQVTIPDPFGMGIYTVSD